MVISVDTQKEMYEYILSEKILKVNYIDSNFKVFITEQIKYISKKLYLRTELYIGKMQLKLDENNKLIREKNYKCKSNKIIFDTLHQMENCNDFVTAEIRKQLSSIDSLDYTEVIESGSADRKKLIKLCKLYIKNKEIELKTKGKAGEEYELAKESFLAETALGIYSKKEIDLGLNTYVQYSFKSEDEHALPIRPDIILIGKNKALVIEIKVYKDVEIEYYGKRYYCSNENRNQVISYIGKVSQELCSNNQDVEGIIIHIVNKDIWDKSKDMQGANLEIEKGRPVKLYMIQDKGLDFILNEFYNIVEEFFTI